MKDKCPWCESQNNSLFLELKDYFLTQEDFKIYECHDCKLLFTTPCPPSSEIGKYYKSSDYLSHNDEKKGIVPFIYKLVKKINIRNKFNIVKKHATNQTSLGINILDIGCGMGDFLLYAKNKGYNIAGLEPDKDARKIAEEKLNIKIFHQDELEDIPDNSLDVVTMWHVLEHVADLKTEIHHLDRVLKKDAKLILALPNYKSFDAAYYKDKWAAYDVPRHLNHFSRTSINNIFEKSNFQLLDVKALKWDSFYISILSEKYANNKNSFIKGIITGCKSNGKAQKTGEFSSLVYILKKI